MNNPPISQFGNHCLPNLKMYIQTGLLVFQNLKWSQFSALARAEDCSMEKGIAINSI